MILSIRCFDFDAIQLVSQFPTLTKSTYSLVLNISTHLIHSISTFIKLIHYILSLNHRILNYDYSKHLSHCLIRYLKTQSTLSDRLLLLLSNHYYNLYLYSNSYVPSLPLPPRSLSSTTTALTSHIHHITPYFVSSKYLLNHSLSSPHSLELPSIILTIYSSLRHVDSTSLSFSISL